MMKKIFRSMLLALFIIQLYSGNEANAQNAFTKGVNLTGWFQAASPRSIQFRKFTKKDFQNIKSLGCDVIRLPINLHFMTSGSPDYKLDPLFVSMLDSAVNWAEQLDIRLILDNHTFEPLVSTTPQVEEPLVKIWPQMATHYRERSGNIIYEILNEPHGISTQQWCTIQQKVINAIRVVDTKHTIIVGASGYNTYTEMANMPVYSDTNLIYTFHFYDPFMFTHQGASWNSPSMVPLAGVPFPYEASRMPACPDVLKGTWVEQALIKYPAEGTVEKVKSLIDIALAFRDARKVKIFCGEFGVYMLNSDTADRAYWYNIVRQYLDEKNVPWTIWDYKGSFGIFNKGSNQMFKYDLNIPLLKSLKFTIPDQQSYLMKPDTTGFSLYDDFIAEGIIDNSYASVAADFYSTTLVNNNQYCIYWPGAPQYNALVFDFQPDKDLSKLVYENYAIDFFIRGSSSGSKIDIRFLDTKTADPNDHPWRMRKTISDQTVAWDKRWHHMHIPLSQFEEQGSWDNNTWYNPAGKFDWSAVDRFEIVTEEQTMTGKEIWLDNILITNLDTAKIHQSGTLGIEQIYSNHVADIKLYPNPMKDALKIEYDLANGSPVEVNIYSITGKLICHLLSATQKRGLYNLVWDGKNDSGSIASKGIYACAIRTDRGLISKIFVKS